MIEVSRKVLDFIDIHNKANSLICTVDGFPTNICKRITLDEKLNMFRLSSECSVDGFREGHSEVSAYYFEVKLFSLVIEELRSRGEAYISLDGFCVLERSGWNHSYASPDDYGYASVQKGNISGNLRLEGNVLAEYTLEFTPKGDKKEVWSNTGSVNCEEIVAMILVE